MNVRKIVFGYLMLCMYGLPAQNSTRYVEGETDKIKVLNLGTFHMGFTTDASSTKFDETNEKNVREVHAVAKQLAEFKPTVILVETVPEYDSHLQEAYHSYLENPQKRFERPDEIELLAYELGRLAGTKRIYGIDHKMGYNYRIAEEIENEIDSTTVMEYFKNPTKGIRDYDKNDERIPLLTKLLRLNHNKYLDFLITINADILAYAGTKGQFEGADEAAKYYQRNLRMFSNMNRIDLNPDDRVFLLMGASHTAFFRDFISRSPKYIMVDTFTYLD